MVFLFLPVTDATYAQPVNEENPYFHFHPDRKIMISYGWNFQISNMKKVNNYGFMSDHDFDPYDERPLLGIIGDSYVEAMQVQNKETMHGLLAHEFEDKGRVYGVGLSGSPLSQYLAYSQFLADEFSPDGIVIVIVGNDFDESMIKYKNAPGFHYFQCEANDACSLKRIDYSGKSTWNKMATQSGILRYINNTLGVPLGSVFNVLMKPDPVVKEKYVGNVSASVDSERLQDSFKAVNLFLSLLPEYSKLKPEKILFVLDGMRPNLYSEEGLKEAKGSYFDLMRKFFMKEALDSGYEVIDMQEIFHNFFLSTGEKFEFYPVDAHWNETGHRLVAEEIKKSTLFRNVFASSRES